MRVVLVRPWTDAHVGGGCCSGDARNGICLEGSLAGPGPGEHDTGRHQEGTHLLAEAYRTLRAEAPEVDTQIVGSGNTAFLLPSTFRAVRRRRGTAAALRALNRATTAGSVLVDGERVGDLETLGVAGVLAEVRRRLERPAPAAHA